MSASKKGIDFGIVVRYDNGVGNLGGKKPHTEKGKNPRLDLQRAGGFPWPDKRHDEEDHCEERRGSANCCKNNTRLIKICARSEVQQVYCRQWKECERATVPLI